MSEQQQQQQRSSSQLQFAFCASGICLCYWFYGALQESLLTNSQLGATFLLLMQTVANMIVAVIWRQINPNNNGEKNKKKDEDTKNKKKENSTYKKSLNHPLLFLTSTAYVLAMICSNESLQYVSYPSAVLAKSCKMIPTMLMGYFVEKRMYTLRQWTSALLISVGIALFNLLRVHHTSNSNSNTNQSNSNKNNNDGNDDDSDEYWKGMLLLFASLCFDGFLGSFQGMLKSSSSSSSTKRPPTANESMIFVNLYAFILLVPMVSISGQWKSGIEILLNADEGTTGRISLFWAVVLLNGIVSIGQIFIFLTITWYSSLVCTTITTTRKFFTILFSVLHYGHELAVVQWLSILMVFSGLYLNIGASSSITATKSKTKSRIRIQKED